MSELKAHRIIGLDERCASVDNDYYLKSEADKVIEEKDKKIDLYKRGWEENDRINAHLYAKLRHSNHKRCLAMAEMCKARYDEEDAKVNGGGASWEYISIEMKYWERWRWHWDALAEEPTWAKFLQLIHKECK